jgi:hypothetical protein
MLKAQRTVMIVATAAALFAAWGCATGQVDYARAFPSEKARSGAIDIQVVRGDTEITLTNTTAESFGPFTLWLNRWFSRPVDGLAVGETITLPLKSFRDSSSEAFRAGGFFATKQPYPVVAADIETESGLIGLTVVAERR